jgi:hypothetical protein
VLTAGLSYLAQVIFLELNTDEKDHPSGIVIRIIAILSAVLSLALFTLGASEGHKAFTFPEKTIESNKQPDVTAGENAMSIEQAVQAKEELQAEIFALLEEIKSAGHEPNTWQRFQLMSAMDGIVSGMYRYAAVCLGMVQAADFAVSAKNEADMAEFDDVFLRKRLAYIQGIPARAHWVP